MKLFLHYYSVKNCSQKRRKKSRVSPPNHEERREEWSHKGNFTFPGYILLLLHHSRKCCCLWHTTTPHVVRWGPHVQNLHTEVPSDLTLVLPAADLVIGLHATHHHRPSPLSPPALGTLDTRLPALHGPLVDESEAPSRQGGWGTSSRCATAPEDGISARGSLLPERDGRSGSVCWAGWDPVSDWWGLLATPAPVPGKGARRVDAFERSCLGTLAAGQE